MRPDGSDGAGDVGGDEQHSNRRRGEEVVARRAFAVFT
jgi:hypothetical protein